jgi:hypothetical protein
MSQSLGWRTGPSRSSRLLVAVVVILAAVVTVGCSAEVTPSAVERVRNTVVRYNRLLAEGYRSMDMGRLRQVADELQSEDEYIHMSSLGEGGVRLLPYLKHFEFLNVSVESTSARVQTRETWDFVHEGTATHEVVLVQNEMTYDLAWDLAARADGRWYVTDVRVMSASSTVEPSRTGTPTTGLQRP